MPVTMPRTGAGTRAWAPGLTYWAADAVRNRLSSVENRRWARPTVIVASANSPVVSTFTPVAPLDRRYRTTRLRSPAEAPKRAASRETDSYWPYSGELRSVIARAKR
jgi:hypothetical protein